MADVIQLPSTAVAAGRIKSFSKEGVRSRGGLRGHGLCMEILLKSKGKLSGAKFRLVAQHLAFALADLAATVGSEWRQRCPYGDVHHEKFS